MKLELWTNIRYILRDVGESNLDPVFDSAKAIMAKLHAQKIGLRFEIVTIRVCGYFLWDRTRQASFSSKISLSGKYEQWGVKRSTHSEPSLMMWYLSHI